MQNFTHASALSRNSRAATGKYVWIIDETLGERLMSHGDEERIRESGCEALHRKCRHCDNRNGLEFGVFLEFICRSRSRCPSSSRPSPAFSASARVCQTLAAAAEWKGGEPAKANIAAPRRPFHDDE